MAIPTRPTTPTSITGLNWLTTDDGSRTLHDQRLNESYHSGCGALAESWLVYVLNSGVAERLRGGQATRVLEYGLGTGTSFLLTAALAEMHGVDLLYVGIENNLLPAEVVADLELLQATKNFHADQLWRERFQDVRFQRSLSLLQEGWVSVLQQASVSISSTELVRVAPHTRLVLLQQDACTLDTGLLRTALDFEPLGGIQAVYFDPFSPEVNPNLWQPRVLQNAYSWLEPGGSFTSYCVKSSVRKDLEQIGFLVRRVPGPTGGKRQVLLARKPSCRDSQAT